jgi:hypothetical protein
MSDNPYAPSGSSYGDASLDANFDLSQAELIRKSHLNHETNVKSFGCLYTLGGIMGILGAIFYIGVGIFIMAGGVVSEELQPLVLNANSEPMVAGITTTSAGVVFLAIAVAQFFAGRSMQTLNPSTKALAIVIAAIGMLQFPCGTMISGYLLYLLVSSKGNMVFSSAYKEVMQATPHIRYRTSIIVWIFLFLLIGVILLGIIAAIIVAVYR